MPPVRGPDDPMPEPPPGPPRPAVFLDRDDTLIANRDLPPGPGQSRGDLADPSRVRLLPGAAQACGMLKRAGYALVIYTNQGVVARGGATIGQVRRTCLRVCELLSGEDPDRVEAVYFCPYHPAGSVAPYATEHPWRKPAPGMILAALRDLNLHAPSSWAIGDAPRDAEAARAGGIPPDNCVTLGHSTPTILDAARAIIERTPAPRRASGRLRPINPADLDDRRLRETVLAAAGALAERTGVLLDDLQIVGGELRVTLEGHPIIAMGFVAELRRATNAWSLALRGRALWPEPDDHQRHRSDDHA